MKAASWRVASGYESIWALPITTTSTTTSPFFSPWNHRPSEQKSRHMATGHGRLDSQMQCACACKRLDEIQCMRKPVRKRMGLCICVCLCVWGRQKGLIQTDHIHRNRWPTQGLPSLFFFYSGSACRRGSTVQVRRVRKQTEGHTHTDVEHTYTQTYISVGLTLRCVPVT